jgi:MoaA/NifB/PqqE/SkfB family radical SAM enzyme
MFEICIQEFTKRHMRSLNENSTPVVKIQRRTPGVMAVTWVINNICTNACKYCPPSLHKGKNHHYDWENAKRFWEILQSKYDKLYVSISGGEPTLSPFLLDFCKMIHNTGGKVGITTNLARTPRYMAQLAPYLAYVSSSFHPSFEDKNFLEKALAAADITPVNIRVMMDSDHWKTSIKFLESCKAHKNITVEAVRVIDWMNGNEAGRQYSQDQLKWFENTNLFQDADWMPQRKYFDSSSDIIFEDGEIINSNGNEQELINAGKTNFKGWSCNMGLESLFIQYTGKVYMANCFQGGVIGDINEPENISWPTDPSICKLSRCHCTTDVLLSKARA